MLAVLEKVIEKSRGAALGLLLTLGSQADSFAFSATVQYDPRCACFVQLLTDFMFPDEVGSAFSALATRVMNLLEKVPNDFMLSSEAQQLINNARWGKNILFAGEDLTRPFEEAFDEYQKVISVEKQQKLQQSANDLSSTLHSSSFEKAYTRIVRLFGLQQSKHNYDVFILPLFTEGTGQAFCVGENTICVDNMPSSQGDLAGVVAHEIVHILFNKVLKTIKDFESRKMDPYAEFAFKFLEDSLTTVIGNRIVRDLLEPGTKGLEGAYNHPIFDLCSLKILPLVESYLAKGKTLDQDFIHEYVNIFKATFPKSLKDFRCLFYNTPFVSDWGSLEMMQFICPYFFTQEADSILWEKHGNYPNTRLFFLKNSRSAERVTLPKRKDYLWVRFDEAGKLIVTVQTDDEENIKKAMKWMSQKEVQEDEIVVDLSS